jgi:hypothetical protein
MFQCRPARVILNSMVIHLRLTVRTLTETVVFARNAELPAIPAIGDQVDLAPGSGQFVVREIKTAADGTITCELDHRNEPTTENMPFGMESIQPELWDLAHAGWRREA